MLVSPRYLLLAWALALALGAPLAHAQTDKPAVDVALVLIVDASLSIEADEFRLQKEGIAQAIKDPSVLGAIRSGRERKIALAYVEWGSPGGARIVVDWKIVDGPKTAENFANAVLAASRTRHSWNAIGDGIDLAARMIGECPCQPKRKVIDVSGDNPDSQSLRPAPLARDSAVADKIVINALAIIEDKSLGPNGRPWLVEMFEKEVIGGPGAFVIPANTRQDFTRALREKMVLEISDLSPPSAIQQARDD
jgi:hypothetical protein